LAAFFAAYPGNGATIMINPERVAYIVKFEHNPFRVVPIVHLYPGLAAKNAANPGLWDAVLSGHHMDQNIILDKSAEIQPHYLDRNF
jgi:hypothetical protein